MNQSQKKVLFVGEVPETVDFTDPALPPGLDAGKIHEGIALALHLMAQRGWDVDLCLVQPDDSAEEAIEGQLARATYDCVVIGGGIRIVPTNLLVFERLVNVVHRLAPHAAIAFNTSPEDTAAAAARWVPDEDAFHAPSAGDSTCPDEPRAT